MMATDRREERAKMSAASFALVLSLFFVCSFAMPYHHHMKEENEDGDEAGRMSYRRGAALLLVDLRRGVAMWCR